MKENFEVQPYCNSRFSSNNTNMLARIQNAFAEGINKCKTGNLPKYIIIILDDDLISYLDCKTIDGVATLFGTWIEWLVAEMKILLNEHYARVPAKCKKVNPVLLLGNSSYTQLLF